MSHGHHGWVPPYGMAADGELELNGEIVLWSRKRGGRKKRDRDFGWQRESLGGLVV